MKTPDGTAAPKPTRRKPVPAVPPVAADSIPLSPRAAERAAQGWRVEITVHPGGVVGYHCFPPPALSDPTAMVRVFEALEQGLILKQLAAQKQAEGRGA